MSYRISISEYQRKLIMRALTSATDLPSKTEPGDVFKTAQEEYVALVQMFGVLDSEDAKQPGMLHGFCL